MLAHHQLLVRHGPVVHDAQSAHGRLGVVEFAIAEPLELAVRPLDPLPVHHVATALQFIHHYAM